MPCLLWTSLLADITLSKGQNLFGFIPNSIDSAATEGPRVPHDAEPADALALGIFAVAVILGGSNFIAVRFSNAELDPFWGAGLRFTLAGALFVLIALALRKPWPRGAQLRLAVVYGVFAFALNYAFLYWALLRVTAGLATIVLAVVPLMTLLLSVAQGLERLRARGVAGALLALAGIGWTTFGPGHVTLALWPLAAMLASGVCVGQGMILSKRLSANHPAVINAIGMIVGAPLLLALSLVAGETWAVPRGPRALWALGYLVTLGSVGLFAVVLLLVRRWTASAGSYMFVLFPVVTAVLGVWLADETLSVHAVAGAVLVMAGVWFGALSPGARAVGMRPLSHVEP